MFIKIGSKHINKNNIVWINQHENTLLLYMVTGETITKTFETKDDLNFFIQLYKIVPEGKHLLGFYNFIKFILTKHFTKK